MFSSTRRVAAAAIATQIFTYAAHAWAAPPAEKKPMNRDAEIRALETELIAKHGEKAAARIKRGLRQVADQWRPADGDYAEFVKANFVSDEKVLGQTFDRFERIFEAVDGHMNEIGRELRLATELEVGPLIPVDPLFASYEPSAHLTDDMFESKLAFVVLLNFPLTTLAERMSEGDKWSRQQWAEARLAGRFARRVPADITQQIAKAGADASLYIDEYNIWMHHLVNERGERLFDKGLKLISHWNLRDELKADYADKANGLAKQRMIIKVMERIVSQSIPLVVVDNPTVDWDPFTNKVTPAPAQEVEPLDGKDRKPSTDASPEPDRRYEKILAHYKAGRAADPFSPSTPTVIARSFELGRELPEERVKQMLEEVLSSPLVPKIAAQIEKKLGRKLEVQDIWFNGFQARGKFSEPELDKITKKKYPTPAAFAKDMPRILEKLGFSKDKAKFLSEHIKVDPSRGAGHAMPALRRGDFPRLRTRIGPDGMAYKGYNIAIHELGHNVEQVFSLYEVDHTLLQSVPNNAFTEALAFVFQARDLELLGLAKPDVESERMRVLNDFWQTWEIAGVALVDVAVWHWMYDHPNAKASELREATQTIAKEIWNKYYAPVLGGQDSVLLGIYSHMIAYPLYLCDYPIGHLIAFQIEEAVKKGKTLGEEFERMARYGSVLPDMWMKNASGAPVGAGPLLRATEVALGK